MKPSNRFLKQAALFLVLPAIALVGCQTPGSVPVSTEATANLGAERGNVVVSLSEINNKAAQRSVLGLGFADTNIVAARVSVIGVDMVKESKSQAWNGSDALSVSLNVPTGNNRLFVLEALDADPATATKEPNVIATIRGVANVTAAGSVTVNLNYHTDSIGRVVEGLHDVLAHGPRQTAVFNDGFVSLPTATPSPIADARRDELIAALKDATLLGKLETFVKKITGYTNPDATHPNGAYTGVNPLYFNADHLVDLMLAKGIAFVSLDPPLPLESFRATGTVVVRLNKGNLSDVDPTQLQLVLQVPFTEFKDGGLFHQDTAAPVSVNEFSGSVFSLKDVPPGHWTILARHNDKIIGSTRLWVEHGVNETSLTITPPSLGALTGEVTDEEGAPVANASVTVTSLDPDTPFTRTVSTIGDGSYSMSEVPAGIQLSIKATRANWTTRERIEVLNQTSLSAPPNRVSFGDDLTDAEGLPYFISDFPEIASVVPDATRFTNSTFGYTVTFSEPLDATNQRRAEEAFEVSSDMIVNGMSRVTIYDGTTFLGDPDSAPQFTWNAQGNAMTLTFDAPPVRLDDDTFTYRMRFMAGPDVIEDSAGNTLGMEAPTPGLAYTEAFKLTNLAFAGTEAIAMDRWRSTHAGSFGHELAADASAPQLTAVNATVVGGETRINMTFNESMVAYVDDSVVHYGIDVVGGTTLGRDNADDTLLSRFTFAIAETAADLDDVILDGEAAVSLAANTVLGDVASERETEFKLTTGGLAIRVEVSPSDPKILRIAVPNATLFADVTNAIKARVEGITDPAGNVITESAADAAVRTGNI